MCGPFSEHGNNSILPKHTAQGGQGVGEAGMGHGHASRHLPRPSPGAAKQSCEAGGGIDVPRTWEGTWTMNKWTIILFHRHEARLVVTAMARAVTASVNHATHKAHAFLLWMMRLLTRAPPRLSRRVQLVLESDCATILQGAEL